MSSLKNGWRVKNAVNRDVERQHLNKILAEMEEAIRANQSGAGGGSASDVQSIIGRMVEGNTETGIAVDYDAAKRVLNFVISNFIIRLSGDVSGQAEVNGLQSVTIPVTINPNKMGLQDAPQDGQAYWRRNGGWEATGAALDQLQYFEGGGFAVLDLNGEWHARIIEGTDEEIDVENGSGIGGDTILSLADVPDEGGGVLQKTEFDSKGRKVGTSEATTDDLVEGTENLYFTEERTFDVIADSLVAGDNVQLVVDEEEQTITVGATLPGNILLVDGTPDDGDIVEFNIETGTWIPKRDPRMLLIDGGNF